MSIRPRRARSRDELALLWTALGDPTRRSILDLLRARPRTTSELASEFPTSRFAVMKHLKVLGAAGLVVARRSGRERWNHLNPIPLHTLYERWVRPYEESWAAALTGFRRRIEAERGTTKMKKSPVGVEAAVHQLEMEIRIAAPPEKVWKALVEDIASWWPKDFHTSPNTKAVKLEPVLGGRLYEDAGKGAGLVWYTVIGVDPGRSLDLAGHLSPAFGGPAMTLLRLELEAEGKSTLLALSDSSVGHIAPDGEATKREGWLALFDAGLRAYVERKK